MYAWAGWLGVPLVRVPGTRYPRWLVVNVAALGMPSMPAPSPGSALSPAW